MRESKKFGRVLVLLGKGFEEIEALAPVDLLRRAGLAVTLASLESSCQVTGRSGITVVADEVLETVPAEAFGMLVIPGGPGVAGMRTDGRAAGLAGMFARAGKVVAAICAAPLVLKDAGLLDGARFTAHFSTRAELPGALWDEAVVEDGCLITSRGAGTAIDFGLALVARLRGADAATEVARAISW